MQIADNFSARGARTAPGSSRSRQSGRGAWLGSSHRERAQKGWQVAAVRIQAGSDEQHARIAAVVARHQPTLLRVAKQNSLCHDDALDAYQRALEIFVRRVSSVDPATEVAWLKVVVRHEAMAIRRARTQLVAADDIDLDAMHQEDVRSVEEQLAATERVRRSAEALRELKPDEAKALVMKAQGLSYDEIGERYGWTYTKVNRSITEGRRRFISVYEGIESGRRCDQFADTLEALAAGEATPRQLLAIRPHLRHCAGCRSTVRALHLSRLGRALLFLPLAGRLADFKHGAYDLLHRSSASDVALSVQAASANGGGRLATAAAVLGICVSGAGVGTMCAVSGLLDGPTTSPPSAAVAHHAAKQRPRTVASANTAPARAARPAATVTASPARHATPRASASSSRDRGRGSRGAATAAAEKEFGFERSTPASSAPSSPVVAVAAASRDASSSTRAPAPASSDPATAEFAP